MNDTSEIMTDAISSQIVQNTTVHPNLAQDALIITEDKVRLCLLQHLGRMEAKREWIAPAGILVTIVATFATTTFKDALFLKEATWQALFIVAMVATAIWLVRAVVRAFRAPGVEDIVAMMKAAGAQALGGKNAGA